MENVDNPAQESAATAENPAIHAVAPTPQPVVPPTAQPEHVDQTPDPNPGTDPNPEPTPTTEEPTFSPEPGLFTTPQSITLAASGPEVVINYTTDGTEPTTSSPAYAGPFVLGTTATVKAIATAPDHSPSPVVTAEYAISVLQPAIAPAADMTTAQKIDNAVNAGVQRAEVAANGTLDSIGALAQTVEVETANLRGALTHLEGSSNAGAVGTIVHDVIQRLAGVAATLETALGIHKANVNSDK